MNSLPDTAMLSEHLSALITNVSEPSQFEIVSRKPFINTSTFPVEIIACRVNDGQIINLFCKYLAGTVRNDFEHRGGVEYESNVYGKVLGDVTLPKPKYYGNCYFLENNETLLVLEYLAESTRLEQTEDNDVLLKDAAAWVGGLHKHWENKAPSFVKVYDQSYYSLLAEQVKSLIPRLKGDYPWFANVCTFFSDNINLLTNSPQTVIHGEYYPKNILVRNNTIYPIDWESAAVAPGEIDLASLIEGWDEETAQSAIEAYKKARWTEGDLPKDFEKVLYLSQIYFHFRWTVEFIETWVNKPAEFKLLYEVAKKAGCV
jgi:thiamine kinase-like enzyme